MASPEAKAGPGLEQGPRHFPSILAAACAGRAALGVTVAACLLALICVQCHLGSLRAELSQLREELLSRMHRDGRTPQGGGDLPVPWALKERPRAARGRRTREVKKTSQEAARQRKKQSVLHLVPVRQSSSSDGDVTEIWWKPFLHQGRALEPSGRDVIVKHAGLYFIYSQVLFHDNTFTMGQELRRLVPGGPAQTLFRCVRSMPADPEQSYNSCYSGGVFHLQHGDRVNLRIPRFNASFVISPHGTFLGLLRL